MPNISWCGSTPTSEVNTDRAGVLCRRHADAMVVPLGWMLDDRRDPIPRLFKAPAQVTQQTPRHRRSPSQRHHETEQLELGADLVVDEMAEDADVSGDIERPNENEVLPWKPAFDQTDDLDGLLEATSPLLATSVRWPRTAASWRVDRWRCGARASHPNRRYLR